MFLWWFGAQSPAVTCGISISLLMCSFKGDQLPVLFFFLFILAIWLQLCHALPHSGLTSTSLNSCPPAAAPPRSIRCKRSCRRMKLRVGLENRPVRSNSSDQFICAESRLWRQDELLADTQEVSSLSRQTQSRIWLCSCSHYLCSRKRDLTWIYRKTEEHLLLHFIPHKWLNILPIASNNDYLCPFLCSTHFTKWTFMTKCLFWY